MQLGSREKESSQKNRERITRVICCICLLLMLFVNVIVGTFFKYYSMVAAPVDDDYSNVIILPSDEDMVDMSNAVIELSEESIFRDKDVLNILLIGTDERTPEYNKNAEPGPQQEHQNQQNYISLFHCTHTFHLLTGKEKSGDNSPPFSFQFQEINRSAQQKQGLRHRREQ